MLEDSTYNLTNRELRLSYWYVTHKLLLRKLLIALLALVCFLLLFFVSWQLAFFGFDYQVEKFQINRLVFGDNLILSSIESGRPTQLQISDPVTISNEDGRNDYFAQISNNNNDWLATFDYEFSNDSDQSRIRKGFILPNERKFLMDLGVEERIFGLNITNVNWQRIAESERIYNERHRLNIANEEFIPGVEAGDPNRLVFDITNDSAFSYWQVGIQAFLYSGGNVSSVNYIILEQFEAGESRHIELNWSNRLPRINGLDIIAEVNVFDEDNIIPPSADADIPIF